MTVYGALDKAFGKDGKVKVAAASASITGTGSITTGLKSIFGPAMATVQDAATTIPTHVASVTSITGGTVNVVVIEAQAAANAIATAAKTVGVLALGE